MVTSSSNSRLIVITGPSGVGKGALVKELLKRHKEIWLSISSTTRLPREGEIEGKDYFFIAKEQFHDLVKNGGFLEWAEFAGNLYGTPRKQVQQKLSSGSLVLLEIELEGARQVRKSFPQAFQVFLAPPSFVELERRIRGRASDSEDAIQRRLKRAKEELKAQDEFDSVIINDDLDEALRDFEKEIGFPID